MSVTARDSSRLLLSAVDGPVLIRGDVRIAGELAGYNTAVNHDPAVVVGATSAADVSAAVRYAASRGLAVGVQATGHGQASEHDAVLITTHRMQRMAVDPRRRTASVTAGVKWAPVIAAAAAHDLAPLSGSTSDAGVVGYTVGGGAGPMIRTFGFAADHVLSLELVTADGQIRHVDVDHDPDLFWAVRGGKANFGIVTRIHFQLVPVARLYAGAVYFAGVYADTVLHAWAQWVTTLPESTNTSIALLRLPDMDGVPAPLRGALTVHVRYAHVGDVSTGQRLLASMRAVAPTLIDTVRDMPYREVDSIHNDPTQPMPSWDRGTYLQALPAAAVDTLLDAAGPDREIPLIAVELRHMGGGAAARQPDPPNAVGGRDAAFSLGVIGPLPPPLRDIVPQVGSAVLAALDPWASDTVPVNFAAELRSPADVGRAWPRDTFERLLAIKRRYDPDNTFRTGNTIAPTQFN